MTTMTPIDSTGTKMRIDRVTRLVFLPKCDAFERCKYWIGALNGITTKGCGINVLRFMGEMSDLVGNVKLHASINTPRGQPPGPGTFAPFSDLISWFNTKFQNMGESEFKMTELVRNINTPYLLKQYLDELLAIMPADTCTIVKLNRDITNCQNTNLTPGHYVLMNKDINGKLWTYEPLLSSRNNCVMFEYKGTVSPNFFNTYKNQCYVSVSILAAEYVDYPPMDIDEASEYIDYQPMDIDDTQSGGNNYKAYVMPDDTMDELVKSIQKSIVCNDNATGGKIKKRISKMKTRRINKKTHRTRRINKKTRRTCRTRRTHK